MKKYPAVDPETGLTYTSSVQARSVWEKKTKKRGSKEPPITYYSGVKGSVEAIRKMLIEAGIEPPSFLQSFSSMSSINDDAAKRKGVIYLNVANPVTLKSQALEGSEDGTEEVYDAARNFGKAASSLASSVTKKIMGAFSSPSKVKRRAGSVDKKSDYSYLMIEDVVKEYAQHCLGIDGEVSVRLGAGILDMYNVFMMKVALEASEVAESSRTNGLDVHKPQSLVFTPCFGYLYTMNGDVGIMPHAFETSIENDWDITGAESYRIATMLSENKGIKTIVLNFPTNPTGKILTEEMARNILRGIIMSGRTDKIRIFSDEITGPLALGGKENFSFGAIAKLLKEDEFKDAKINLEIYTAFSFSKVISADDRCAFVVQKRILQNCKPDPIDKDREMMPKFSELPKEVQEKYKVVMKDFIAQKRGESPEQYDLEAIRQECRDRIDHIKLCSEELNKRISTLFEKRVASFGFDAEALGQMSSTSRSQYVRPYLPKDQEYPESGNMLTLYFSGLNTLIPQLHDADSQAKFLAMNADCVLTSGGAFCSKDLLNNSVLRITLRGSNTIDMVFSKIGDCIERAMEHGLNEDMTIKAGNSPSLLSSKHRNSVQSLVSDVRSQGGQSDDGCIIM